MDNLISDILSICNISGDAVVSTRSNITYTALLTALLSTYSLKEACVYLGISEDSLYKLMFRYVSKSTLGALKPKDVYWRTYLLNLCNLKDCNKCKNRLSLKQYVQNQDNWDGLTNTCKTCKAVYRKQFTDNNPEYSHNHYTDNAHVYKENAARYKASRIRATPSWANHSMILDIYKNCPEGFHVDHIYPLQSDWVCGLHVEHNLRHIPAQDNIAKSNNYIPELHE